MILYQLRCSNGHEFEAWFRNSSTFDLQVGDGDVACPHCADTDVSKAIMAPNIAPARSHAKPDIQKREVESETRDLVEKVQLSIEKLRTHVEATCDDVGDQFAEEARRIHYGETEVRGIYGEATGEETEELNDEGIEFYRLPSRIRRDS